MAMRSRAEEQRIGWRRGGCWRRVFTRRLPRPGAAGNEDLAGWGPRGVAVAQHPKSRGRAVGRDRRKLVLEEGVFQTRGARTVYQKVLVGGILSSMLGAPLAIVAEAVMRGAGECRG